MKSHTLSRDVTTPHKRLRRMCGLSHAALDPDTPQSPQMGGEAARRGNRDRQSPQMGGEAGLLRDRARAARPHRRALALLAAAMLLVTLPGIAHAYDADGTQGAAVDPPEGAVAEPDPVGAEALQELADPELHEQAIADTEPLEVLTPAEHRAFARAVDLSGLRHLAVFDNGRVKTLETMAQEHVQRVYGRSRWRDPETGMRYDPVFTYLDLVFNHRYYLDKPIVHIEVLPLQRELMREIERDDVDQWTDGSRVAPLLLNQPGSLAVLQGRGADLRFYEAQQQVLRATTALHQTGQRLLMVSPMPGQDQWAHLADLADPRLVAGEAIRTANGVALSVSDTDAVQDVNDNIFALAEAWRTADAEQVNAALATLTQRVPQLNPETYPAQWRLTLEAIYNATHKFTLGYLAYLVGTIALLIAFAVGRKWIITTGVAFAVLGFVVHSGGMLVRGLLSGRWPIHNQFESFIAFTWFAVLIGLVLMLVRRQWLFGAAATALGTCALLMANVVNIPSQDVARDPGILATSNILYIHVNVVLVSYALIALAFFISLIYLAVHYFGGDAGRGGGSGAGERQASAGDGPLALVRFAAVGLGHELRQLQPQLAPAGAAEAQAGATLAETDTTLCTAAPLRGRTSLLRDLDTAQLIVMQLAFWTLGAGILLGAYWADHAWGRWWGWDPKEVWSLITWIVYLIAIHARFGVRNRGLVTAWLCVVGFFVMLWTYWGVNLLLAGLHSYA